MVKGLSKVRKKTHKHRQQCGDYQRERRVEAGGRGKRGDKW